MNEREWPGRSDFLRALDETEKLLREYAKIFTRVAEVPELTEELDGESSSV